MGILEFAYLLWLNRIVLKGYFLSYDTNMFQDFIEILILSAIQGISEFLPISSSAHLIIVSNLYYLKASSLLIDISLHLGSLLAIIFFFRKDLFDLKHNQKLLRLIIEQMTEKFLLRDQSRLQNLFRIKKLVFLIWMIFYKNI